GGTFVSTINLAGFEDSLLGTNVSALALDLASRITMRSHSGPRTGPAFENDPNSLVDWAGFEPYPGCVLTSNVGAGQPYATISAGVAALPATLPGHSCVVVRDGATYAEQVTVQNFTNAGSSITILAAPGFAPVVSPPAASTAAFLIANASVNVQGISVVASQNVPYGVWASSSYVALSGIGVSTSGPLGIYAAGVRISSWSAVVDSTVNVWNAHGIMLQNAGMSVVANSTSVTNSGAFNALFITAAASNTVTGSYIQNLSGSGARLDAGSAYNTISQSTMVSNAGPLAAALYIGSGRNLVTGSYMRNFSGHGAILISAANNVISQSTMVSDSNSDSHYALYLLFGASNTVTGSYVQSQSGVGVYFDFDSDYNLIAQSTMVSSGNNAIVINDSDWNTLAGSYAQSLAGQSARVNAAVHNTIIGSTIVSQGAGFGALYINRAASTTAMDSYIQGSTAAVVTASTGTVFGGSVLTALGTTGSALVVGGGGVNLTVSTSTLSGGPAGAGILLEAGVSGLVSLTTNTVIGGRYGVSIATMSCGTCDGNLTISSLVFTGGLASGATAIHFTGGTFVSTFSHAFFPDTLGTNVNGSALSAGSRITMRASSGPRTGPAYENDPSGYVDWQGYEPFPGCAVTNNVGAGTPYPTIQSAVDALPGTILGHNCVIVRDAGTYAEQVTLRGFETGAGSITVRSDPALPERPVVDPPAASTAAFFIQTASVTVAGFDVKPTVEGLSYGVWASSGYVSISTVNVDSGGRIDQAGMRVSSWTTVERSSVTTQSAHAYLLDSTAELSVVRWSTGTAGSGRAVYRVEGSSNVLHEVYGWSSTTALDLRAGGRFNEVRGSTMASNGCCVLLSVIGGSSNTIVGSVVAAPSGRAFATLPGAVFNTIIKSTFTTSQNFTGPVFALASDSNTIRESYFANDFPLEVSGSGNLISGSTVTSRQDNYNALGISGSSNTVSGSVILSGNASALSLSGGGHSNRVVRSTVSAASTSLSFGAIYAVGSGTNTVEESYVYNPVGHAINLFTGAHRTSVLRSTVVSNAANFAALFVNGADSGTFADSWFENAAGTAVVLRAGADHHTLIRSTAAGGGAWGLYVSASSSNTVLDSYVQGGTAAFVTASTGTVVGGSVLAATGTAGGALVLAGGSVNLSVTTSALTGGAAGAGLSLSAGNSGLVSLTTNAVSGGRWGLSVAAMSCGACDGNLSISSLVFAGPLAAGATAVDFAGGAFVSTFAYVDFSAAGLAVNVNGLPLSAGSRIWMKTPNGARAGPEFENDPNAYVDWEGYESYPGCAVTRQVGAGKPYATIQAGVDSLPATLTGHSCVVVAGGATYNEQVTVANFVNAGSSITILGDPTSAQAPVVSPPAASTAAFLIANASVNVQGISVVASQNVPYGVWGSSSYLTLSGIGVSTSGALGIYAAGVRISSWSALSYSTVTVWNAHGIWLDGSVMTSVSYSTAAAKHDSFFALYLQGADYSAVTGSYIQNLSGSGGGASLDIGSDYNVISQSTMISSGDRALYLFQADSNTVTGSLMQGLAGYGAFLHESDFNTITFSTIVADNSTYGALYVADSDSNTLTGSYIQNLDGSAAGLDVGSAYNAISLSTMVSNRVASYALYLGDADSNTVTGAYIHNPAGHGAYLSGSASYNTISLSTMISNSGSYNAFYLLGDNNTLTDSYFQNLGHGALLINADYNTIIRSTMVSNSSTFRALALSASDRNTVTDSYFQNLAGVGVYLFAGSDFNTIIRSTMTSASTTPDRYGLQIVAASSNTVLDSYVQGSTAVFISGSTGTVIGGGVLVATSTTGSALYFQAGVNLTVASSTLRGGTAQRALGIAAGNAGRLELSTITIVGGGRGLELGAPLPGADMAVTSVTLAGAEPAGTGVHFLGGVVVATITAAAFNDNGIGVNVNGAALSAGSRVTMRADAGTKTGPNFELDPSGYVDWPDYAPAPPGTCETTRTVKKTPGAGDHTSIQAAVNAIPALVTGDYCIFVDSSPYSESVVIANKDTQNLYRIKILSDPAMLSTATRIIPPVKSTAAFVIWNASVTIGGFNVVSTNSVTYGVLASSANIVISSVNVDSGGKIGSAGIKIAAWSLLENSSITVQNAHGIWLDAAAGGARIRVSTALADSASDYALFMAGVDSAAVTGSYIWNLDGHAAFLDTDSDYNAISQSTMVSSDAGGRALYLSGADSNTVTGSYMQSLAGSGAFLDSGSDYNTISQSTIVSNTSSYRALHLVDADSNTVTGSYIQNLAGYGAFLDGGSDYNAVNQSTMISNSGQRALYLNEADSNTVAGSYMQNLGGSGVQLDIDASYNTISQSTMVSNGNVTDRALFLTGSSNTVTGSYIQNLAGDGAYLSGASYNTISQSTMVSNASSYRALRFLSGAASNTVTGSYIQNLAGAGAHLSGASYNTISQSTMVSNSASLWALYLGSGSDANTVSGSIMQNLTGHGVALDIDSDYNTIIRSSMTSASAAADQYGLNIIRASSNTILDSYIQGSTAAFISGSTGTVIGGSVFAATNAAGGALFMHGGVGLSLASSTLSGGSAGLALGIGAGNAGRFEISTVTVVGGASGVQVGAPLPGMTLAITSLTLANQPAGATGLRFLGGVYVATVTAAAFYDADIAVNVDGAALSAGSRVTMRADAGTKTGPNFELDPSGYVDWPDYVPAPPGTCETTRTVKKTPGAGDHTAIQAAVDAIPALVTGDYCIFVDSSPYSERVVIANKDTQTLYRIKILSDPAMLSTATPVIPPVNSMAAFVISNASVTIGGFNVVSTNSVSYGVLASSANIVISSVNVDSGGNIASAGVKLAAWSLLENSSITVQNAHGIWLDAAAGGARIRVSTALAGSSSDYALYMDGTDSATVTGSYIQNLAGYGAYLDGADHNTISQSTMVSNSSSRALYLDGADSNTVTGSYIQNLANDAAYLNVDCDYNTISQSTMVSNSSGNYGLYLRASDNNTVTGSYIQNLAGHGLVLDGDSNTISFSTIVINVVGHIAFGMGNADGNTVTGSYIQNLEGYGAYIYDGSAHNTISLSTMVSNAVGSTSALYIADADSNTVSGSFIQNLSGYAAWLNTGAEWNAISQSTVVGGSAFTALYLSGADSNTVTGSYIQNLAGAGTTLFTGSDYNTISLSTMLADHASFRALTFSGADHNIVTDSDMRNLSGAAAGLLAGSDYNAISVSTMVSNASVSQALYMSDSDSNTVTGSYLQNLAGDGAYLFTGSDYNTISQSTIVSNAANFQALYLRGADRNTVTGSYIQNLAGYGATLDTSADYNTIILSTMTSASAAAGRYGLYIVSASSNALLDSYVQGSSAAFISRATGTVIGGSVLAATQTAGAALTMTGGSVNMTLTTSTLSGGPGGAALSLEAGNSGTISLSSNTISGGRWGVRVATMSCASCGGNLSISSLVFAGPLSAGATAIDFTGGTFVSTFAYVDFAAAGIAVNVNGGPLAMASKITMVQDSGSRTGPAYENDPNGRVDWSGLVAPTLLGPAAGAFVSTATPAMVWSTHTAGSHRVQLASDSGFVSIIADSTTANAFYVSTNVLVNAGSYWWRVSALGGLFSAERSFTVDVASPSLSGPQVSSASASPTWVGLPSGAYLSSNVANVRITLQDPVSGLMASTGLPAGLVGQWRLDEGSGTYALDASANGLPGTLIGGPVWTAGKRGGALDLNAASYVSLGNPAALQVTGALTVSAWVNLADLTAPRTIYGKWGTAQWGVWLGKYSTSGGRILLQLSADGSASADNLYSYRSLDAGAWYHIAAVNDPAAGRMCLYINGVEDHCHPRATGAIFNSSANAEIGSFDGGADPMSGRIDEVRVFNVARSSEQILADYQSDTLAAHNRSAAYNVFYSTTAGANWNSVSTQNVTLAGATNGDTSVRTLLASDIPLVTSTGLAAPTNQVAFVVSDFAGNVSTAVYTVYVDTMNPVGPCEVTRSVRKLGGGASYTTIGAALAAVPNPLTGHSCVVIRDGGTYAEQVSVENFVMNGSSLSIMADPASGLTPVVSPPAASTAAFRIANASVNVQGISVVASQNVPFGVWASSANVTLSGVGVSTSGALGIYTAGVRMSSWSALANSTVTVWNAHGLWLDGSAMTTVSDSTAASKNAAFKALYLSGASGNTVARSYLQNLAGGAADFGMGSDQNTVSQSTFIANYPLNPAFQLVGSDSNTVTGSYVENLAGYAVLADLGSDYNALSRSTMVGGGTFDVALYFRDSDRNVVADSYIENLQGYGAMLTGGADHNTIIRSTVSSVSSAGLAALSVIVGSSNTVLDSYIQGSIAVFVSNSSGTVIGGSVLAATHTTGSGLYLSGALNMTLTTSTLRGGPAGIGFRLASGSGIITLTSNTVTGGRFGLSIADMTCGGTCAGNLNISSLTFTGPLAAGATAIEFLGGDFISTFTGVGFDDTGIAVNVNASALSAPSRITMLSHSGARTGPPYENDPNGRVDWEGAADYPGCVVVNNVGAAQTYGTIQSAVDALPSTLTGHSCVVIRDGATYAEQVTVQNFLNNGSSITIFADPASGLRPVVDPPAASTAAFLIQNASVTVAGVDVKPTVQALSYGVFASSGYVTISSVNVDSGGEIGYAGVKLSSWSALEYSSVTVQAAHGVWLDSLVIRTQVRSSTMLADSAAYSALYVDGADTTTVSGSYMRNAGGNAAFLNVGSLFNTISQSTVTSNAVDYALYLEGADSNTVTGSFIESALFYTGSDFNTVSQSTLVLNTASLFALNLIGGTNNTVTRSLVQNLSASALLVQNNPDFTISESTIVAGGTASRALYLNASDGGAVTGSYIENLSGDAVKIEGGSDLNVFSQSTVAAKMSGTSALALTAGSSNTFTGMLFTTQNGTAASLGSGALSNVINLSTMVSAAAGGYAFYALTADGNEVDGSFLHNSAGHSIFLDADADRTAIMRSTSVSGASGFAALYIVGSDSASVSDSWFANSAGTAVFIAAGADHNVIIRSSMTGGAKAGLFVSGASSNTVLDSYIQGPTGASVSASTGTTFGGSLLAAADPTGSALALSAGSVNLTLTTSSFQGGSLGAAIRLERDNSGLVVLTSNTVTGGRWGLSISTMACGGTCSGNLSISSLSFSGLTAGATAIEFLGGTFVSTFSYTYFPAGLGLNVNGSLLNTASRITMRAGSGPLQGPDHENDPNSLVDWADFVPPAIPLFYFVAQSSVGVQYGLVGAEGYVLLASSVADFSGQVFSSVTANASLNRLAVSDLDPNTTYYLKAGALWNGATSYASPSLSTATLALGLQDLSVLAMHLSSGTAGWAALPRAPPALSSQSASGYLLQASTAADFSGTLYSSATSVVELSTLSLSGLFGDATYYFRAASLNRLGAPNFGVTVSSYLPLNLGVDITTDAITFPGLVPMGGTVIITTSTLVTNVGNVPETFRLRVTTVTPDSLWAPAVATARDRFTAWAVVNSTQPSDGDFADEDKLAETFTDCGAAALNMGGDQACVTVQPGDSRTLWIKLAIPTTTTAAGPQQLRVLAESVRAP
ncbi:MAG: right-handed parallel beta-helix repeat-containing protein, partial [Elusimicrobia bacterium]|nr:right-handed parallel beta-helix repeat-containing protein [Elusimicrobiota bacterium]